MCRVYHSTRSEEMTQSGWNQAQIAAFLDQQFHFQDEYYKREFPDAEYSVIVYEGQDAGRLYMDYRDHEHRIIDIALLPEYRGKGLGGKLLKKILHKANMAGKPVGIHVEQNNPAMHLYKRLGFVKTGETGIYHLMVWKP